MYCLTCNNLKVSPCVYPWAWYRRHVARLHSKLLHHSAWFSSCLLSVMKVPSFFFVGRWVDSLIVNSGHISVSVCMEGSVGGAGLAGTD